MVHTTKTKYPAHYRPRADCWPPLDCNAEFYSQRGWNPPKWLASVAAWDDTTCTAHLSCGCSLSVEYLVQMGWPRSAKILKMTNAIEHYCLLNYHVRVIQDHDND